MAWKVSGTTAQPKLFDRLYPLKGTSEISFAYQIQSQFPFLIASTTDAVISSRISRSLG